MKSLTNFITHIIQKRFELPYERRASLVIESFSRKERIIFYTTALILTVTVLMQLFSINRAFMTVVPATGGSITEGVIGTPRFINPLLAISDADRDLTVLVYSGLMRAIESGSLETDLAQSYTVSEDGTVYTFTLKDDLQWHDGEPITSDDIVYTIEKAQDTVLKSPRRASWDGVIVEKINDRQLTFTLAQPYAPFLENTTMGILPRHIWQGVDSEQFGFSKYNVSPIGSGPYKIKKIKRDDAGIPIYYDLVPFNKFALGAPYISTLRLQFYSNTNDLLRAFDSKEIESMNSIAPSIAYDLATEHVRVAKSPLPRVFAVFFNQNESSIFTDRIVRKALNMAIDKKNIIDEVLYGYGTIIDTPIPPGALGYTSYSPAPLTTKDTDDAMAQGTSTPPIVASHIERARELLENNGWEFDTERNVLVKKTRSENKELSFSLSTSNVPELQAVVDMIKTSWEELGARIEVKIFESGSLNQNVIRPRNYDALFFGEVVGRSSDLFAFWHSSQRLDPGLNVALYANITTDQLLEKARAITSLSERAEIYQEFEKEIAKDIPAFFMYSPDFIYVQPHKIQGVSLRGSSIPSERFLHIYTWYIDTDRIWNIFTK